MKISTVIVGCLGCLLLSTTNLSAQTPPTTQFDSITGLPIDPSDSIPVLEYVIMDDENIFKEVYKLYENLKSIDQLSNRNLAINAISLDDGAKATVFEKNAAKFAALTNCYLCTYNDVIDSLASNPFFAPYLPPKYDASHNVRMKRVYVDAGELSTHKSTAPSIPGAGSDWSRISDGLGKFLVSRTKAELNYAFLDNFGRQCNNNPYLKGLFPNTRSIMSLVSEKAYNVNPFLINIRDAVHTDFRTLPEHITTFLQNDTLKWIDNESRSYLLDATYINRVLFDPTVDPGAVINHFSTKSKFIKSDKVKTIAAGVGILGAGYFILNKAGSYELNDFAKNHQEDDAFKAVFLGVFYQKHRNLPLDDKKLGSQLNAENGNQFFDVFTSFARNYLDAEQLFKEKNNWQADNIETVETNPKLNDYLQLLTNTLDGGRQFMVVLQPQNTQLHLKLQRITDGFSFSTLISQKVTEEKWGEALLYTGMLISTITGVEDRVSCQFIKYGSFMASVVNCTTSDEIAAIIETFALPVGSSRAKKNAKFSIDIGAYVGGYGGWEFLKKVPAADRVAGTLGLHAPVGLAFSWGKNDWSYTGYATLIDVAAFTAFRFDHKDYIDELPELSFSNIFAPGAAFIVGIPKYPIALGLNAQVGPNIRGISENGIYNFKETGAWRIGATVLVDIPLFNFYANGEKFNCSN